MPLYTVESSYVQFFAQSILDDLNVTFGTEYPNDVIYQRLRLESMAYRKTVKDAETDDYRPKAVAAYHEQPLAYPMHHALCQTLKMHGIVPQHWANARRVVKARNNYAYPEVNGESPELVISAYIHTHALRRQDASALEAISEWLVKNGIGTFD